MMFAARLVLAIALAGSFTSSASAANRGAAAPAAQGAKRAKQPGKGLVGWWKARREFRRYHRRLWDRGVAGYRLSSSSARWEPLLMRIGGTVPAAVVAVAADPNALTTGWGRVATGFAIVSNVIASLDGRDRRRQVVRSALRDAIRRPDVADLKQVLFERDGQGRLRFENMIGRYAPELVGEFHAAAADLAASDQRRVQKLEEFVGRDPRASGDAGRVAALERALDQALPGRGPIPLDGRRTLEGELFRRTRGDRLVMADQVARDASNHIVKFVRRGQEWTLLNDLAGVPAVKAALGNRTQVRRDALLDTALRVARTDAQTREVLFAKAQSGLIRPVYEQAVRRNAPASLERFLAGANQLHGANYQAKTQGVIWDLD